MTIYFGKVAACALLGTLVLVGCSNDDDDNQAPTANAGTAQSVKVNQKVTLDGSKSKDPDGDKLTFKWAVTKQPQGSTLKIEETTDKPSLTPAFPGEYEIELTVSDGQASGKATVKVTATPEGQNGKPTSRALGPTKVLVGSDVVLDGSQSSDPDQGDALTYKWALGTKPANSNAAFADTAAAKPKFKADLAGEYIASLIVNDGKADSGAAEVKIKAVATNTKPVANAGAAQSVAVNASVTLDGSASSDADQGDVLTYKWTLKSKPAGSAAALNDATAKKPTFTADKAGEYAIELVVNDELENSAAVTVKITAQ
ncbi:PKD domain-containing protein [Pendulispora brunnea]|uniref:PKD domain-containing protein n=1 Tax=Pendulispora brunnea TaxID=2905690 RepID=A0ABZ2K924_9BACT